MAVKVLTAMGGLMGAHLVADPGHSSLGVNSFGLIRDDLLTIAPTSSVQWGLKPRPTEAQAFPSGSPLRTDATTSRIA
jgi:hypothetical protein